MPQDAIRNELLRLRDEEYGKFTAKLIPNVDPDSFLGVRTPELRRFARELLPGRGPEDPEKAALREEFLAELPHRSFEEGQLHAFIISGIKDYGECVEAVEKFLPFVDNWATCDQMTPAVFRKHRQELLERIKVWLGSERTYTVRFAVKMLMDHYLEEDFDPAYLQMVADIRSEEYYINMMIAWYFATALAKQYDAALPYIRDQRLAPWTHNKAIQKSVESRRITPEQKEYLKSLRMTREVAR